MRPAEPFDDIFHHHDRPVDQQADGDSQAPKAHEIGGQAHTLHEEEGDERRHREGSSDNRRRPPVTQEQDEQHDDKHGGFEQGFLDRADGARDQIGPIVENIDMGAGGQCAFDFREAGADTIDHLPRIGAAQGDHQSLNSLRLAILADRAITCEAANADRRQLAEPNDAVAAADNDQLLKILDRPDRPHRTHDQGFLAAFQAPGAIVAIAAFDRRLDIGDGEPCRRKRNGIGPDLEGPDKAAQRVHVSDAGNGAQRRTDGPVEQFALLL